MVIGIVQFKNLVANYFCENSKIKCGVKLAAPPIFFHHRLSKRDESLHNFLVVMNNLIKKFGALISKTQLVGG